MLNAASVAADLDARGYATTGPLPSDAAAVELAASFDDAAGPGGHEVGEAEHCRDAEGL
jgi:hypothetical protein